MKERGLIMYSVSVIMPVYNNENTLRQAIESILNQTMYDLELILINDGSTDRSGQICDEYEKLEPLLVEVIHQPKTGFALARNKGIIRARGKYMYFANARNTFDSKMLEANVKLAEEKDAELVVFGFSHPKEGQPTENNYHMPNIPFLPNQERFRNHYRNFHHFFPYELCNKLFLRDYLINNRIKFYNTPLKEQAFFNLLVYKDLNSVAFNRIAYCMRQDPYFRKEPFYQDKLFEVNMELAKYFEAMVHHWEETKGFEDLIIGEYYNAIHEEILNVTSKRSELSETEQQERIKHILADDRIRPNLEKIKKMNGRNPYHLALLTTLKNGNGKAAIQLVNKKNDTKETTSKIKNILKGWFNQ